MDLCKSIKVLFRLGDARSAPEMIRANGAETTARIDALMSLPIKERSSVTLIGDEGVSGYDPPAQRRQEP
jgi:hypothetical protein